MGMGSVDKHMAYTNIFIAVIKVKSLVRYQFMKEIKQTIIY